PCTIRASPIGVQPWGPMTLSTVTHENHQGVRARFGVTSAMQISKLLEASRFSSRGFIGSIPPPYEEAISKKPHPGFGARTRLWRAMAVEAEASAPRPTSTGKGSASSSILRCESCVQAGSRDRSSTQVKTCICTYR
ncbi:unnamed protein product, partial [Musa textilis]